MSDFVDAVNAQRPYLLRIARLQLSERDRAEDVVRSTLQAALEARDQFAANASIRPWLLGILKGGIIDAIRGESRERAESSPAEQAEIDDLDIFFDANDRDRWAPKPAEWRNPERDLEQQQFIEVVDSCLAQLPPAVARVYAMRELMGLEPDEICRELRITATSLWVMLYRARMLLRKCLEQNWFARTETAN